MIAGALYSVPGGKSRKFRQNFMWKLCVDIPEFPHRSPPFEPMSFTTTTTLMEMLRQVNWATGSRYNTNCSIRTVFTPPCYKAYARAYPQPGVCEIIPEMLK